MQMLTTVLFPVRLLKAVFSLSIHLCRFASCVHSLVYLFSDNISNCIIPSDYNVAFQNKARDAKCAEPIIKK